MSDELENIDEIDDSEAYQEDDLDLILEELENLTDEDELDEEADDEGDEENDEEDDNPFAAYDAEEWN